MLSRMFISMRATIGKSNTDDIEEHELEKFIDDMLGLVEKHNMKISAEWGLIRFYRDGTITEVSDIQGIQQCGI